MLIPSERVPGFAFHQTERGGPHVPAQGGADMCADGNGSFGTCYKRDFDLLGYK